MLAITGLKCLYDTDKQTWAVSLSVDGDPGTVRIALRGPEHVETFLEAFEDATESFYDPETKEVVFSFEYEMDEEDFAREEDEEDLEEDEDDEDEEDEDEDDDAPAPKKR